MSKRAFLQTLLSGMGVGMAAMPLRHAHAKPMAKGSSTGPALLTVSGAIGAGNRGPLNPALDRLLAKQKVSFAKAHTFDAAALAKLPQVSIQPTLEYDAKRHTLQGPALLDVIKATGAKVGSKTSLLLRAIDGYAVQVSMTELTARRFVLATHLDGQPMSLGGLGPLWAVYNADQYPDLATKPLTERFSLCPWATYHIEVKEG
jgi:hypothetical protein